MSCDRAVLFAIAMRVARVAADDTAPHPAEVIEVSGTAPDQAAPQHYELTPDEIRGLPGAANDVLRGAQALPGVARIPFSFGGLALRGASPRDTGVVMDGIELPLAFHFGGVTSVVPSDMLASLAITSSNADVSYGRMQGGVVTLTTRDPRTDRWRVSGSIGVFDSGVSAEGPLPGNGGLLVGVRRSYLEAVAGPFLSDSYALPAYWDAQIRTAWGDSRGAGRIAPMFVGAVDTLDAGNQLSSAFVRVAVPYLRSRGATTLAITPWLGWSRLDFSAATNATTESFSRPVYRAGLRAELVEDTAWGDLRGGTELNATYFSRLQAGFDDPAGPQLADGDTSRGWGDAAVFGEMRWQIAGGPLTVRPGVRVEHYGLTGEIVVDPRLSISQELGAGVVVREALGRYHQPPLAADLDPTNGNPELRSSYADQASLGLDATLPEQIAASITGFYRMAHDLDVPVGDSPGLLSAFNTRGLGPTLELLLESELGIPSYRENLGRARSYGLELSAKRSAGRWFGLLSYTLARAERTDDPRLGVGWRPFELDQRHNLQLVGSARFGKERWRAGLRLQVVSGNPYTPMALGSWQAPDSANLPVYASLDLRIDRTWYRSWGDVSAFLDLHNVTNRANVEARTVDRVTGSNIDTYGLPILPFIGVAYASSK
jgi:hypothetical protein